MDRFKVLLVDDERVILDGISSIVDWNAAETELSGTARNGIEAFQFVEEHQPDIILSDIRMPGMDGLELVAKVKERYPRIRFILLSGFDEFEYAKSAMHYGVKHYLLKPCNEQTIVEALKEIVAEYKQDVSREQFIQSMKNHMTKMLPHVKEQFLKEFVTNKTYGSRDWEYYREIFGLQMDGKKIRLILFRVEGIFEYEHLFAVKNIAEDLLSDPLLSSTFSGNVLIVVEDEERLERFQSQIDEIRRTFSRYYKLETTVALSGAGEITEARRLYAEALECLGHRFYLGEGGLITKRDISGSSLPAISDFAVDEDRILLPMRTGNWEEANTEIDAFFQQLADSRLDIQTTKSYVLQLYISMTRLCPEDQMNIYMSRILQFAQLDTLQANLQLLKEVAFGIANWHYEQNKTKHSAIIRKVLEIVEEHLANSELSLNWVAHQMLYMNPDYLGKLFKKETGERFSNYVVTLRVNKAIELIKNQEDVKIFELAEQLGFGGNPQYFSQVFKKITGYAPSEFKKNG